jgi:hypothetical protein
MPPEPIRRHFAVADGVRKSRYFDDIGNRIGRQERADVSRFGQSAKSTIARVFALWEYGSMGPTGLPAL